MATRTVLPVQDEDRKTRPKVMLLLYFYLEAVRLMRNTTLVFYTYYLLLPDYPSRD